jgi:ribosome-associated protein
VSAPSLHPELQLAVQAALQKKAEQLAVLDLRRLGAFTDFFVLCSGASQRQVQAICEAVEEQLSRNGLRSPRREGHRESEWVLLDYGWFIVHVFSERARLYYDLDRLWRAAPRVPLPESAP